jgi:GcrA cell cycle regulator
MPPKPCWTADRIQTLVDLWQQGHSASQIAQRLGGITRNSAISKLHRLGLSHRGGVKGGHHQQAVRIASTKRRKRRPSARATGPELSTLMQDQPLYIPPPIAETDIARVALVDLESHHCRWPVHDPRTTKFGFCGDRKLDGLPYCLHHCHRAYDPVLLRRRGLPVAAPVPSPAQAVSTATQLEDA